jgi:cytochrome c2
MQIVNRRSAEVAGSGTPGEASWGNCGDITERWAVKRTAMVETFVSEPKTLVQGTRMALIDRHSWLSSMFRLFERLPDIDTRFHRYSILSV